MNEDERAACVRQAVAGNADALQRLIIYYHDLLRELVGSRMDARLRRRVDPDDVLQDAYAAAFQSITGCSFDGPGGFYKWLETIAANQLKETVRDLHRLKRNIGREQSRPPAAATSYPDLAERLVSPGTTPSRKLGRREASSAVISSMARLTDDQRTVVRMRFIEDRSVAEVAAAIGKSEDAVHMLCHRGLTNLRTFVGSMTRYLSSL